jgi:PAS domain S-box-containing protein
MGQLSPGPGGPAPPISLSARAKLTDLAEDAILSTSEDQRIVLFNRGAERTFGYTADEVIGQPLEVLFPMRFAGIHRQHMRGFAKSDVAARVMGERLPVLGRRKDGTEFPAEVTISKFQEDGRLFFSAILRDVTDRVRADEEIRALNRELEDRVRKRTSELEEANRQLSRKNDENETFVYSVSHDLRSPLVNLEGFSQELAISCGELKKIVSDHQAMPTVLREKAERILDQEMAEAIGYIQASVSRLTGIIDALLRLSRAGRVHYEPRRLDLGPVVARVVQALRKTVESRKATVSVGPLLQAWADPTATEQVFANLIGNALQYLDPARPGIVEVGAVANTPDLHTYFVRDNGLGIPKDHQAQMFQAFRRLHADLAPGEGMGLVLVRRVLERLGGQIWFESCEGVGSTFYFTLPAASPEDPAEQAS